jgi:hypothetical protein
MEIPYVANMQKIEASIGKRNAVALGTPGLHLTSKFVTPENFGFA